MCPRYCPKLEETYTDNNVVLDDPVNAPSPRYWLVWPGTMLLLAGSFAEVAANYRTIYASVAQLFQPLIRRITKRDAKYDESNVIKEPCSPEEMVPVWMWGGGIVVSIVRIVTLPISPMALTTTLRSSHVSSWPSNSSSASAKPYWPYSSRLSSASLEPRAVEGRT